jgi:hypothetical protein
VGQSDRLALSSTDHRPRFRAEALLGHIEQNGNDELIEN